METRKSSLTASRRRLLALMQNVNFGIIEGLVIRGGQPVFDPPPGVVRDVKFCAESGPRPEAFRVDFALKAQVRDLFTHFDRLCDATIRWLEVKHGLPFRMHVEEGRA